jgi:phosphoribosylglycinamide formyltransferase 1
MKKIIFFASGNGSNVENCISHFINQGVAVEHLVFTNNKNAGVIERIEKFRLNATIFSKDDFKNGSVLKQIQNFNPDLIVLAGFLLLFPVEIINLFPNKIINIHPSLLPKFGGKGMYGMHVHNAVLAANEKESGITIHYVTEHYDEGTYIAQFKTSLEKITSPEELAKNIHHLEYEHFPKVIETLLNG